MRNHSTLFKSIEFSLLLLRLAVGMTPPGDSYKQRGLWRQHEDTTLRSGEQFRLAALRQRQPIVQGHGLFMEGYIMGGYDSLVWDMPD